MNGKKWREKPYRKLIHKLFLQTLSLMLLAALAAILIRSLGQGKIGNAITHIYCQLLDIDWETGAQWYYNNIRKHYDIILSGTMLLFFLVFFRLLLSWFTKYFDEIIAGVNELTSIEYRPIVFSPELDFMVQKLTQVQRELVRSREIEREEEKRKNDLIVYLAHDIKTPLTSVIGYLNLIDEISDMDTEQRKKYVKISLEKAYRLEKLINEFFEITRYNLQSVPLHCEPIDLSYMMIQIVDETYPLLSARQKTVTTHVPRDIILYGDSEKLARVFNNILKNAIAYSDDASEICIDAAQLEHTIQIRFMNPGTISQENLSVIFEKFYRLDQSRQTATGGAGLGLAIAKDIVTLHNGTISANCENDYITFTVTLPAGDERN